jgi:hypothetical protein
MRGLCIFVTALETASGLGFLAVPAAVTRLLFGQSVTGAGVAMSRLAGIALIALALAWWAARDDFVGRSETVRSMLLFNALVSLYLLLVGIRGELVGALLWPVFAMHAVETVLLGRAWFAGPSGARP